MEQNVVEHVVEPARSPVVDPRAADPVAARRSGAHLGLGRRVRRAAVPLASGLVGTLAGGTLAVVLVGCSALSPATIATPYPAADGVEGSLTNAADGSTIELRNMLIVAGESGGRGQVIGTLTNTGDAAVQVELRISEPAEGAAQSATTRIAVPPNGAVQLGAQGSPAVVLTGVPAAGRLAGLTAATSTGGTAELTVPVMAPQGYYATLTPPATSATP